jgi:hypothetical protein
MTTQNVQAPSHEVINQFDCIFTSYFWTHKIISKSVFLSQLTTVCTNIMTLEAKLKTKRLISYNQKRDRLANLLRGSDTSAIYLTALK